MTTMPQEKLDELQTSIQDLMQSTYDLQELLRWLLIRLKASKSPNDYDMPVDVVCSWAKHALYQIRYIYDGYRKLLAPDNEL